MKKHKIESDEIIAYIVLNVFILSILFFLYYGVNISEPIDYDTEILYFYALIKSIVKNGWYLENPFLASGTFNMYGFNLGNIFQFFVVKLISFFSDNVFQIFNIFYILSFLFVGNVAFYTMESMGIERRVGGVCSVLFSFLPYHQLKTVHGIAFIDYACVPIFIYLALYLMGKEKANISRVWLCLGILAGFSNIYYVFLGCVLLCCSFLITIIRCGKEGFRQRVKDFASVMASVLFSVFVTAMFSVYGLLNGYFVQNLNRKPWQAENYCLNIIQLLLPRMNHRIRMLADMSEAYVNRTGAHSEGMMVSLGIVGSIGFIGLIISLFRKHKNEKQRNLAFLNMIALFLGISGGVGIIIAYLISSVRVYARISVFIAFLSFLGLASAGTDLFKTVLEKRKFVYVTALILILVVGIYDQTVSFTANEQEELIAEKDIDREFVEVISDMYSQEQGKVWQMPYKVFQSGGWEYMKGFLFDSGDIIWSGATIPGSDLDKWANRLGKMETEELLEQLILEGYNGIWLSKETYRVYNQVDVYNSFIDEMESKFGLEPIYSSNKELAFFDLRDYIEENSITANKILYPSYSEDFYDEQKVDEETYQRWCGKEGTIILNNPNEYKLMVRMEIGLKSVADSNCEIEVNGTSVNRVDLMRYQQKDIDLVIECVPGNNVIIIRNSAEEIPLPVGVRNISFAIYSDKYVIMDE